MPYPLLLEPQVALICYVSVWTDVCHGLHMVAIELPMVGTLHWRVAMDKFWK